MSSIKGLIFDFDGLILDTEEPSFNAWSQIYAEFGVRLDVKDWANSLGSSESRFNPVTHLEELVNYPVDAANLRKKARLATDRAISKLQPLPGVENTLLNAVQMGLKLAIASSSPRAWVMGHLNRLDLTRYFNAIVCMEDVPEVKPAPDLFLAALAALGLQAPEAIIFEDSPNGINAGRLAGVFTVAIPNAVSRQLNMPNASLILNQMNDIPLHEIISIAEIVPELKA